MFCFPKQQFLFPHTLTTSFTPVCLTSSSLERHSLHPHTLYTTHKPAIHLPDCTHALHIPYGIIDAYLSSCLYTSYQLNRSTHAGLGCLTDEFIVPRKVPHTNIIHMNYFLIFVMRIIPIGNTVKSWKFLGETAGRDKDKELNCKLWVECKTLKPHQNHSGGFFNGSLKLAR